MVNPLQKSISSAVAANQQIGGLFARLGSADHPRGFISMAYRQADRAMRSALSEPNKVLAALDVMNSLRHSIQMEASGLLMDSYLYGEAEAMRQMKHYGVDVKERKKISPKTQIALDALLAKIDAQTLTIQALLLTGAEDGQIVGNDERKGGVLRASDVLAAGAIFAAGLFWNAFSETVDSSAVKERPFSKQAVAGLDERTTDCCLRVHGQVQPLDGKFNLTGRPRFADEMDWAPFHWYCRTSIALYLPEYDMGLTDAMRSGADQIMSERAAGGSGYRHPADAFG